MAGTHTSTKTKNLPNGAGMAAILAAGIGCAALGVFAFLGDAVPGIGQFFNFYRPTGTLSGVTDCAIGVWLIGWYGLTQRWKGRDVAVGQVSLMAFVLLAIGFVLMFPPFIDLLQGN
ncbi:MAG: hypothetical protein ACYC9J_08055 [Sulfuricaulis sp.]